jgi:DNA adenine methylase
MRPEKMRREIEGAARLLAGRSEIHTTDFRELLAAATPRDLVYMDPPYQGVSAGGDPRYVEQLNLESFLTELDRLNSRGVSYLLSFDGYCGTKQYGQALPKDLGLTRVLIKAGRSSQATLVGRSELTTESLYISPSLRQSVDRVPRKLAVDDRPRQTALHL